MPRRTTRFDLYDALGYLVYQVSGAIRDRIDQELGSKGYPISVEDFTALIYIWDQDGQSQSALGKRLHRDRAYVTRLVSEIESLGFVQRIPSKEDSRQKRLFLTEKGKSLMDAIIQVIAEIMKFAGKGIDSDKMRNCKEVLRQVLGNLTDSNIDRQ
jgi:MarR family transcriptional regulator, organic hydroperoxide resistance regulator